MVKGPEITYRSSSIVTIEKLFVDNTLIEIKDEL